MKSFPGIFFFFFFLRLFINESPAQNNSFRHLTTENGLPQNSVYAICQDKQGFMWFGTADGLCRYDGYEVKVFRNRPGDSTSLIHNFIRKLLVDKEGNIWVGTEGGLCVYNPLQEKFAQLHLLPGKLPTITLPLNGNSSGNTLAIDGNGRIFGVKLVGGQVVRANTAEGWEKLNIQVYPIEVYNDGHALIYAEKNRVCIYNSDKKNISKFLIEEKDYRKLLCFLPCGDSLLIGTAEGLIKLSLRTGKYRRLTTLLCGNKPVSIGRVFCMIDNHDGRISIGTGESGFFTCSQALADMYEYKNNPQDKNTLSFNTVRALLRDQSGNLWIGTDAGGINIMQGTKKFIHYHPGNSGLPAAFIKCFYSDKQDRLFVGTHEGGMCVIDFRHNSTITYSHKANDPASIHGNIVHCFLEDHDHNLWLGLGNGLARFDAATGKFEFEGAPGTGGDTSVIVMHELEDGRIIIASTENTYFFNPAKKEFRVIDNKTSVSARCFYEDGAGTLWMGMAYRYPFRDGRLIDTLRTGIGNITLVADTRCIQPDHKGNLWLATTSGLARFHLRDNSLKFYTEKDGLPNTYLYGILADEQGNLWISSNKGISKFNPANETFRNYDESDGLQSTEFNSGAFYKDEGGAFYFGGVNGFNVFYPDSVRDNPVTPQVSITSFKIFDKEFFPDSGINYKTNLILPYDQNTLAFAFAGLEFTAPQKNRYACRLLGLDTGWVNLGTDRSIRLAGLQPGTYTLQVKACNNDGIWGAAKNLGITIIPPVWKRTWFIGLNVLAVLSLFALLVKYFSTRKLKRRLEELERIRMLEQERERISRDMHDEIGSGLSKISLLCEIAKQKEDLSREAKDQMDKITQSSRQIVDNMSEIIWSLNPKHDTLYELLAYMRAYAADFFESLPVTLRLGFPDVEISGPVFIHNKVRRNVFLVYKEILNNIVKHSGAKEVEINIEVNDKGLTLRISDNGKGFSGNPQKKYSNGLNNMKQRMKEIGGEITIESGEEKGTRITLTCTSELIYTQTNTTLM